MTEPPRDWDKELAEVDRLAARTAPGQPTPGPSRVGMTRDVTPASRGAKFITWTGVVLTLAIAAALPLWPYGDPCGIGLFFYLGTVGVLILLGGFCAVSSWGQRLGLPHILSLFAVLWGLVLTAEQILPRIGYARAAEQWICSSPVPPPAPTTSPAPTPGPTPPAR